MGQGVRTYDPRNVQVIIGAIPITGFADGTFVTVTADEDLYAKTTGAQGEVSRARSNNRGGTLTLTLKQTSPANDVLSGFALADEASNAGVVPVLIKELGTGRTLMFSQAGWIQGWPEVGYSKAIENRAWTIALADITRFIGGNESSSGVA